MMSYVICDFSFAQAKNVTVHMCEVSQDLTKDHRNRGPQGASIGE